MCVCGGLLRGVFASLTMSMDVGGGIEARDGGRRPTTP